MKLLFDENLSRKLVPLVEDLFPGSAHISRVGMSSGASDRQVWDYAGQNGFVIVTADSGPFESSSRVPNASVSGTAEKPGSFGGGGRADRHGQGENRERDPSKVDAAEADTTLTNAFAINNAASRIGKLARSD